MDNKNKAVFEVLGNHMSVYQAKRLFNSIYEFILYNDTQCFLDVMDYRMSIQEAANGEEDYHLFKYMLQKMKAMYPSKLASLHTLPGAEAA